MSTLDFIHHQIAGCTQCGTLQPWRKFPRVSHGTRRTRYMLIGEAPGAKSLDHGRPFTGPGGNLLRSALAEVGDARFPQLEDLFYITDMVKCHPQPSRPGSGANRGPAAREVHACLGFLIQEIELVRPRAIIGVGAIAARYLPRILSIIPGRAPELHLFPHPSPRNTRQILAVHGTREAYFEALVATFRNLVSRLPKRRREPRSVPIPLTLPFVEPKASNTIAPKASSMVEPKASNKQDGAKDPVGSPA